ncbi:TetR/AcrR family transcriptional regulator [Flavobacterium sp. SE-s28]|uniref:TetR/AcrR family transcriptional regulator n=2 Tax=Flavobacterium silvaticum TaxID=1852020 RepID=A0A972FW27_9FLAO|nr:TetR/AcrR family transcriptional regulator [Flavobacterium silvaticum]
MKEKIIAKATEMFLKLGFKSVTMDDIAGEMCISKKTIYKFFCNKEVLIEEATETVHQTVNDVFECMQEKGYNPVEENFEIRKYFKGIFQSAETSPLYQLRKHYPEIYETVISKEKNECFRFMQHNLERGIAEGYYRTDTDVENSIDFYYTITFHISSNTALEKDAQAKELAALVYHTRAISTPKGLEELEKQLAINS